MRLLHTNKIELQAFTPREVPSYAILSHTWGEEEVTLQNLKTDEATKLQGYEKVSRACLKAAKEGFDYIWIDTCCIDKTSSAELSEALNSMYRWYQEAEECYAYLADVPHSSVNRVASVTAPEFRKSRWFTRGWTLQELIAPSSVIFLDSEWEEIGTRSNLQRDISEITGIPGSFLLGDDLRHASVAQRLSWASKRETTRTEDLAYCLMGLFGIYMPMLYGEGERAFIRLQEEIMRVSDDHSLFAWRSIEDHGGILATSPAAFANSGNIIPISTAYATSSPSTLSSRGIHLSLRFIKNSQEGKGLAILHCTEIGKEGMRLALHLRDVFLTGEDFVREQSTMLEPIDIEVVNLSQHPLRPLYARQWRPMRKKNLEDVEKCVVKLTGTDVQDAASCITNVDSNCELSDGLIIMDMKAIPDGELGRLVVICKDGNLFQVLLSKNGRSLSADISASTRDLQHIEDLDVPEKEQNDQDRIVKALSAGQHVHIAIKKRVLLLRSKRCLTGVVEISYSSSLKGAWLEHIAILEKEVKEKTLLSYTAKRGLKTIVGHLLDKEGIESSSDDDLRTPLSWAAEGGQEEMVRYLLKRGATLYSNDKIWRTPLSWAAGSGHVATVRLLMAKHIENQKPQSRAGWQRLFPAKSNKVEYPMLEDKNGWCKPNGWTPLFYAAANGHVEVTQLLLDWGPELKPTDGNGQTLLSAAARNGHVAVVRLLLDRGAELDSKDTAYGQTPLSWAARYGQGAIVTLLLDRGAELDSKDTAYGQTPLLWAARNGQAAVVTLLLDRGAELDSKDTAFGQTPLSWAARYGQAAVVTLLLDRGAELDFKDIGSGWTPLSWAAGNGHAAVVMLLLDRGAELDSKDTAYGQTPLSRAAQNGHAVVVALLLDRGAELDSKDTAFGQTLLSRAAQNGHAVVVALLLDRGAKLETKDTLLGQTPLSWAARNGHEAVVTLLLDRGAEIDSKDTPFGQTPLSWAARNRHEAVITLLLDRGAELDSKDTPFG